MHDQKKPSYITAQTALCAVASIALALLGWIGSVLQRNIEQNGLDIQKIQLSLTAIETRLEAYNSQTQPR